MCVCVCGGGIRVSTMQCVVCAGVRVSAYAKLDYKLDDILIFYMYTLWLTYTVCCTVLCLLYAIMFAV